VLYDVNTMLKCNNKSIHKESKHIKMLTIMENDNNNTKQQYPTEEILNSAFDDLFNRDVEKYNRDMEISRGVVDEFGATYSKRWTTVAESARSL
jgi:hypothetical protein